MSDFSDRRRTCYRAIGKMRKPLRINPTEHKRIENCAVREAVVFRIHADSPLRLGTNLAIDSPACNHANRFAADHASTATRFSGAANHGLPPQIATAPDNRVKKEMLATRVCRIGLNATNAIVKPSNLAPPRFSVISVPNSHPPLQSFTRS
jgi:hypothetical protein